jgi:hypothetical protein
MNKGIVWSIILIPLLVIGQVFTLGCKESEPTPQMTAPEVCQYVSQALSNKYEYVGAESRYELSYSAQEATYIGGMLYNNESDARVPEGTWFVTGILTKESQQLIEGQWVSKGIGQYYRYYHFNENTAELIEQ